jgi:Lipoprotein LpqB beta-propeller domain/Sporulation and spore germination
VTIAWRPAFACAIALVALLAAGCVSVPDSGPVRIGPSTESEAESTQQYVRVPKGPAPGAEPAEIVRGYLAAMRALPADPTVVRAFMTEDAAAGWRPNRRSIIFAGAPVLRLSGVSVRVSLDELGTLDQRGSWTSTRPEDSEVDVELRLVQRDGQWRITNPAPGLLIDQEFFDDYYRAYSLYFFDPTHNILVPEQIYLPDGEQTATALLRGLVSGPTRWLKGAVDSFLPADTDPAVAVPVDENGVATVPLGSDVLSLPAEQRQLLAVQLAWTFGQVPEVRDIEVVADGAPVSLVRETGGLDPDYGTKYDPADAGASRALYALQDQRVVIVDDEAITPVPGLFGSGELPVSSFGVDRDGRVVAGVTDGGTAVTVAGVAGDPQEREMWFSGGVDLLRPQWDFHDRLWIVDRQPGASVFWTVHAGKPRLVNLAEEPLTPSDVRAFAVSRDGMRLAVIDGRGEGARLLVGRVTRPANGTGPLAVDRWREIVTPTQALTGYRGLSWSSPTQLAVLALDDDSFQPVTIDIDGSDVGTTALVDFDPRWIAANPTQDTPTVVGDAEGVLHTQTTNERWTPVVLDEEDPGLSRPAYVE